MRSKVVKMRGEEKVGSGECRRSGGVVSLKKNVIEMKKV